MRMAPRHSRVRLLQIGTERAATGPRRTWAASQAQSVEERVCAAGTRQCTRWGLVLPGQERVCAAFIAPLAQGSRRCDAGCGASPWMDQTRSSALLTCRREGFSSRERGHQGDEHAGDSGTARTFQRAGMTPTAQLSSLGCTLHAASLVCARTRLHLRAHAPSSHGNAARQARQSPGRGHTLPAQSALIQHSRECFLHVPSPRWIGREGDKRRRL